MAQKAQEMAEVQGREERMKKFNNDKRPWTNTPKPPLPPKVKRRRKPGVKALQEIRKFQMIVENVIPHTAFQCVVRDISQSLKQDVRWSAAALSKRLQSRWPQVFLKMQTCVPSMQSE